MQVQTVCWSFLKTILILMDPTGESDLAGDNNVQFPLGEKLDPLAGGFSNSYTYAISPVGGNFLSEFSVQYLTLFLLSSLVRYRPQSWTHAISRSSMINQPADDETL